MKQRIMRTLAAILIIGCIYVWWVLSDGPGLMEAQIVMNKVHASIYKTRALVWPFIWKRNIYGN